MLVISSLRRGGAERIVSILANRWTASGYDIWVVTVERRESDAYLLGPSIHRVALDLARVAGTPLHGLWNNLRRVRQLRAAVRDNHPDVVVSFVAHTNLLTLLSTRGTRVPVIVSERVDPTCLEVDWMRRKLRAWLYPRALAVVMQTRRAEKSLRSELRSAHFAVIPNLVCLDDPDEGQPYTPIKTLVGLSEGCRIAMAMGRLDPQKGFDLLIDAFAGIHLSAPDWHLVILGEGRARPALEAQVNRLGLAKWVHLPGIVRAVRRTLADADLFVLSSRYEGFPNALLEAMACGRPVVSFDCPSGPAEIIRDGNDGLLVKDGDVAALEAAMLRLMQSQVLRDGLGRNAREILERFSMDRIMALWGELLTKSVPSSALNP